MVFLSKKIGETDISEKFSYIAETVFKTFHKEFWNGTYFVDWIDWKKQEYFASHPNFLALIYGLSTKDEASSILNFAKLHCLNTFTLHNVFPAYPFWRIPLIQTIGGIPQYHNRGILWLQPGITYALALHVVGKNAEAKNFMLQISDHIVKYQTVYEVRIRVNCKRPL
jgi:uncharacterized protein (DUF608 family)